MLAVGRVNVGMINVNGTKALFQAIVPVVFVLRVVAILFLTQILVVGPLSESPVKFLCYNLSILQRSIAMGINQDTCSACVWEVS